MDELIKLIGHEYTIKKISRTLCSVAGGLRPRVVGAMHVTCADESEYECAQAFQKGFVQHLLPPLKSAHRSPFRISNLGGRYDLGAVALVEDHFRLPADHAGQVDQSKFKLIVVKVNSHVGVSSENGKERYGTLMRYGTPSTCCGALSAVMAVKRAPNLDEIRDLFLSGGTDRLAVLLDGGKTAPEHRSLYAAVLSAGLQARRVLGDIRVHTPVGPTLYLVVPCVTLNRPGMDTEILCGVYTVDHRFKEAREEYTGLG
ncbi:MAG: hypothetical protein GY950_33680, partial [bacterium]|nr:hypothetical protein [bacterium]